jgi:hypothetical protein
MSTRKIGYVVVFDTEDDFRQIEQSISEAVSQHSAQGSRGTMRNLNPEEIEKELTEFFNTK